VIVIIAVESLDGRDTVGGVLLLKLIHLVPAQLVCPPSQRKHVGRHAPAVTTCHPCHFHRCVDGLSHRVILRDVMHDCSNEWCGSWASGMGGERLICPAPAATHERRVTRWQVGEISTGGVRATLLGPSADDFHGGHHGVRVAEKMTVVDVAALRRRRRHQT
jgi:hypothetical protein